jgi:iron complex outermembrane receptor protein
VAIRWIFLVCTLALTSSAFAQDGDIEEVIVTATRLPTEMDRLPFAVSRVDKEEIQLARQQLGLDESLAGVPGLFFQNRYNFAQDLRIAIRGFGARADFGIRGIYLVADDIPLTLPDGQGSVDSIDLGSAESIEVIRGPFSAVYGAASGGVIQIHSQEGPDPPFLSARLNLGSYGFGQGQLKTGGQSGQINYMANLSATKLDGYREHADMENRLLNSRFRYQIDDSTRLTFVINAVDSPRADDPGALTAAEARANRRQAAPRNVLFNAGESLEQQSMGAALTRAYKGGSELLVRAYYVHRDFENRLPFDINSNGQGGNVDLGRQFYGLGGRWTTNMGERARLVFGADYEAQRDHRVRYANLEGIRGDLTTNQDEDVTDYAVYAQGMWSVTESLTLNAGVRLDEIDYRISDRLDQGGSGTIDFSELSPMAGISWALGSGKHLYANISQSFDPPATTELANPDAATGFNQSLESQTALNMEVGFKGERARLRYEVALFHIDVDGAIVPYELEGSGQTFYENFDPRRSRDFSAGRSCRRRDPFAQLHLVRLHLRSIPGHRRRILRRQPDPRYPAQPLAGLGAMATRSGMVHGFRCAPRFPFLRRQRQHGGGGRLHRCRSAVRIPPFGCQA